MKRHLFGYFLKKITVFLLSILLLSAVVYFISAYAPGDPLMSYYGERVEKMSAEEKDAARERLGLNDPVRTRYVRWLKGALGGDFGISYRYKEDVTKVIADRIGNTLLLGGVGFVLTAFGALGLGILCAWHEDKPIDRVLCKGGAILSCIPEFWLSLVLILLFSVTLHLLPSSGAYAVGHKGDVFSRMEHLILPLCVVVAEHLWYYAYMVRNKLLEETRAEYVLLGRAKGLSKRKLLFGHCLRNVLPSYISIMAISVAHILGGTYIVETVFSYPGIGTLSYESAQSHDYNMLMVLCILSGIVVIFFNLIGQIINERLDPRIKAREAQVSPEVNPHG